MKQQTEELDELQRTAIEIVTEHLRDKKHQGTQVDYALRGLSAVARLKGTERARDATQYAIVKDISKDEEEFKKYIGISLPHLNPTKQLE